MSSSALSATPMRRKPMLRRFTWATILGLALVVTGCVVPPRGPAGPGPGPRPGPSPSPSPGPGPGPATGCAPGSYPIGVLAVTSNTLFRNGVPARSGERVCNGDHISTNATGSGDLLLDGDRASDSVHFAEGTDPSITVTPNGCVNVDAYRRGRITVTARRRCMVLRTPDTLLLLANGSAQLEVIPNQSTVVVPLRGSLIKLRNLPLRETAQLSAAELGRLAAPRELQPLPRAQNVYRNFIRVVPILPQRGTSVPRRSIAPNAPVIQDIR